MTENSTNHWWCQSKNAGGGASAAKVPIVSGVKEF